MKLLTILGSLGLLWSACAQAGGDGLLTDLDDFRWENRILLVFGDEDATARDRHRLEEARLELEDRDLLWFWVSKSGVLTNYEGRLSRDLGPQLQESFLTKSLAEGEVVLLGKDGGVKQRSRDMQLTELFRLIDSMPMRQQEMKQR